MTAIKVWDGEKWLVTAGVKGDKGDTGEQGPQGETGPAGTTDYAELTNVPSEFPPESHTHPWGEVTGQPATATRWPTFTEVTSKPATATRWPTWGEVTSKPSEFPPESHAHNWSDINNPPATATRWPTWGEVTSKPSTFPPETHNHDDRYYMKSEIDTMIGDIGSILDDINGEVA